MTHTQIIDRIKKLFALANSSNEHEAQLAAQRAAELMARHQVSHSAIDALEDKPEPVVEANIGENTKNKVSWKAQIAWGVAESLGCAFYVNRGRKIGVGPQSALDAAQYIYAYLVREVARLANEEYVHATNTWQGAGQSARAWKDAFRIACASRLCTRLRASRAQTLEKIESEGTSLVRVHETDAKIRVHMRTKRLRAVGSSAGTSSRSGSSAGSAAGDRVRLPGGGSAIGRGCARLGS